MRRIDVADEFYHRLANRDSSQGDRLHTGLEFRRKFLSELDDEAFWSAPQRPTIVLDFRGVQKIGPSFANEAFTYFTKYADLKTLLSILTFENISPVQRAIVMEELEAGYKR